MDSSARKSLAGHCEQRAREIRAAIQLVVDEHEKKRLPLTNPRTIVLMAQVGRELGAARALEEITVWARKPHNEEVQL